MPDTSGRRFQPFPDSFRSGSEREPPGGLGAWTWTEDGAEFVRVLRQNGSAVAVGASKRDGIASHPPLLRMDVDRDDLIGLALRRELKVSEPSQVLLDEIVGRGAPGSTPS